MDSIELKQLVPENDSEPGTPRQLLFQHYDISNEETIGIRPFKSIPAKVYILRVTEILTLGLLHLILTWLPEFRLKWIEAPCSNEDVEFVAISDPSGTSSIEKVSSICLKNDIQTSSFVLPSGKTRYFEYKKLRFYLEPLNLQWVLMPLETSAYSLVTSTPAYIQNGLDTFTIAKLRQVYGSNSLVSTKKSIVTILLNEVLHPFYLFQAVSVLIWLCDSFVFYSCCIVFISSYSIFLSVKESKESENRIHSIIGAPQPVTVIRNQVKQTVLADDLVIGDLLYFSNLDLKTCPVDGILFSSSCLLDESMVTGESVPARKFPLEDNSLDSWMIASCNIFSPHLIHAGTKFLKIDSTPSTPCLISVVRTGFRSNKGQLIRNLLYPNLRPSQLYLDSMSFLKTMAILSFVSIVFIAIYLNLYNASFGHVVLRSLDVLTILVPPALPATLSVGIANSIARLSRALIYTTSPESIHNAGCLSTFVFDKTGTLTENSVQLSCVYVKSGSNGLLKQVDADSLSLDSTKLNAHAYRVATCSQSLELVGNELVGDPLEVTLFTQFNGTFCSTIRASNTPHPPLFSVSNSFDGPSQIFSIYKALEFDPVLRRMSVICSTSTERSLMLFTKGAPESILAISSQQSIPSNVQEVIHTLSSKGFRIIAFASKNLITPLQELIHLSRSTLESNVTFQGLFVLESPLRESSKDVISSLLRSKMEVSICSGDSLFTSVFVAKHCGALDSCNFIYTAELADSGDDCPQIHFEKIDLQTQNFQPIPDGFSLKDVILEKDSSLCMDGKLLQRLLTMLSFNEIKILLSKLRVLARMSPFDKATYVELCQKYGCKVGFCGDGANDCIALKQADVGVSLSDSEACAAASFVSKKKSIKDVFNVLLEGRCSLILSHRCFQYMVLCAIVQFSGVFFLYLKNYNFNDNQFLFMDLLIIFPLSAAMSYFDPAQNLTSNRPNSTLFGKGRVKDLGIQSVLIWLSHGLLTLILHELNWVELPEWQLEKSNTKNVLVTSIFLLSSLQYLGICIGINQSSEFL